MFDWDADKSETTRAVRGFGFEHACRIFAGDTVEIEDRRQDYGEQRILAIGDVEGVILAVVFVRRARSIRIISARRENRREREVYASRCRP